MLEGQIAIREEVRKGVKGKIFLCPCGKEMFKTEYYERKSSGYCSSCSARKIHSREKYKLEEKKCKSCEKVLNISKFSFTGSGHYRAKCIKCSNLGNIFNININDYNTILDLQKGKCAICNEMEIAKDIKGNIRSLAVDHDHKTGKVRGLLCTNCNTALGGFKDNIRLLENAIKYITKNES